MLKRPMLLGFLIATVPALRAQEEPAARSGQEGALERVDPVPSVEPEPHPLARVFERGFDREEWRGWLATPDLDQRERHFDDLLRRARIDPAARVFLEELARDPAAGELAWTARLALRELGAARVPVFGLTDPFRMHADVERLLRELLSQPDGMGFFLRPPSANRVPNLPGSSRSVEVAQTPAGARIVIQDADPSAPAKERVYEGESVDAILAQNPELARELTELGVSLGDSTGEFDLRFDFSGGRWRELLRPFDYGEGGGLAQERAFGKDGSGLFAPQGQSRALRTDVLGVKPVPVTPEHAAELGLEKGVGLFVVSTYPGTIAHVLGVRAGDVLLELNGATIRTDADITAAMQARAPADALTLVWVDVLGQRQTKTWRPEEETQRPRRLR